MDITQRELRDAMFVLMKAATAPTAVWDGAAKELLEMSKRSQHHNNDIHYQQGTLAVSRMFGSLERAVGVPANLY